MVHSVNKRDRLILFLLHPYGYSPILDPPKVIRPLSPLGNIMTTQLNSDLRPIAQGLYDPQNEHDACGVGFVAHIKGKKSHEIVSQGLQILENLDHRGAVGADPLMGDGAGILIQIPDTLYRENMAWA